jgi:predicted transcriptional regulator
MVKIERISLEKKGLTKFFSPNESRIMELLWKNKKMTSSQIKDELDDLSLACVAGTLDRLVKSGFANRKIDDNKNRISYIYSPMGSREKVGDKISEKVIESLVDTFGSSTIDAIGRIRKKKKIK